ncbi:unnamed protein product [Spirodela intermedia]|nr:unnamed protein product [Spirodela intermedia]CAA6655694.1 unnamed protein product [Spirodela intermedia]
MEGDALDWYLWMEDRFPFCDWYDFKIQLSACLPNILTEILEHTYLKGLKPEIQSELSMSEPIGLREIMDTSIQAEAHICTLWQA